VEFLLNIIRQKIIFFLLFIWFIIFCAIFFVFQSKSSCFIYLHNISHTNFLKQFFNVVSFIGNGYFTLIICLLFVLNNNTVALGFRLIFTYIFSGLVAQLLKKTIQLPRPKDFFNALELNINLQDAHTGFNSFPSGHTTTAFAIATIICLSFKNKFIQIPIFFLALLVGYSRIYLGHHFLEDVLAGCILGTLTGVFTFYLFENRKIDPQYKRVKSKKSII
jgi:membrane-associated phospholipid phosphatase